MKRSTPMSSVSIGLCMALALVALPSGATILGVLGNNTYSINETTGANVLLSANVGAGSQATSMAKNSSGVIYIAGSTATPTQLKTVDPVTGIISPGPVLNLPADFSYSIRGLAFDSADVLYAVNNGNVTNTPPYKLYTINPATGQGTFIGLVNGVVQGLEFGPTGTLYGWEVGSGTGLGLVTINPATGAITDVNPLIGGTSAEVQTLAVSAGGTLYGANSSLYTVNVTTGALTLVAAMNPAISIQGMAFVSAAPPAAPAVSLTPPSLTFGNQQVATTSVAQALTLQNTGTGVLNIASIVASGDFAQTNTCGAPLAASASCIISVTFTPTTTGVRSGSVTVASNAPGSPHVSSLSGTGVSAPPPPPPTTPSAPIPTLSQWGLILLAMFVALAAWRGVKRRSQ
jgi:hypothetical protein